MMTSINELLENMTDEIYFKYPAVHHSDIVSYERNGFKSLFTDIEKTPSLIFGSLVDCLLTDKSNFSNLFYVSEGDNINKDIKKIVDELFHLFGCITDNIETVSVNAIDNICDQFEYCMKTKSQRVNKVIKGGGDYYKSLTLSNGKTVVSKTDYLEATAVRAAILNNDNVKYMFMPSRNPNIEVVHQAVMKEVIDDVPFLVKFDSLTADHTNKVIIPVDLKTTGKDEYDFYKSYIEFGYDYQSRLYCSVLKRKIEGHPYFKDFKIADFKFVVINRRNRRPAIWNDSNCMTTDEVVTENGNIIHNPFKNAKLIWEYKKNKPDRPIGFEYNSLNELSKFI